MDCLEVLSPVLPAKSDFLSAIFLPACLFCSISSAGRRCSLLPVEASLSPYLSLCLLHSSLSCRVPPENGGEHNRERRNHLPSVAVFKDLDDAPPQAERDRDESFSKISKQGGCADSSLFSCVPSVGATFTAARPCCCVLCVSPDSGYCIDCADWSGLLSFRDSVFEVRRD